MAAACGDVEPEGRVHAVISRPRADTVRFTAPARANRCSGGRGLLLQASTGGNGVVVWLRTPDSLAAGLWPLLQRGDTVSPRGATVGARFMVGDLAHGVPLDSGAVTLGRTADALSVTASGTGLEGAGRVGVVASFDGVRVGPDTVPCAPRP